MKAPWTPTLCRTEGTENVDRGVAEVDPLDKLGVPERERKELLKLLGEMKGEIVERS